MDETNALIKQAVPIQDVIGEYLRLEATGSVFRGLCPFHEDHKPSLIVDPRYQNYRCWACGAKGDVFRFVQDMERITFPEAKERLAERAGIDLRSRRSGGSDPNRLVYQVLAWAQEQYQFCLQDDRLGGAARQYLVERGITEEAAREFGLGFAPSGFEWLARRAEAAGHRQDVLLAAGLVRKGKRELPYDVFRERLLFPIRDERGRVLGFGGRILPGAADRPDAGQGRAWTEPKYLNTPATSVYNKSEVLYGIEVALAEFARRRSDPATRNQPRVLVVMEGYTDCVMAYQHGFRTAVATCGTALTERHVAKLRSHADQVVLMFDGDAAGRKAARESTRLFLRSEIELRLCVLPDGMDPCDFIRKEGVQELRRRVAEAPDAIDFHIGQARESLGEGALSDQWRALDGVLATLAQVPRLPREWQRVRVDLGLSRLARGFGVPEERLRARIEELREGPRRPVAAADGEASEPLMRRQEREIVQWLILHPPRTDELLSLVDEGEVSHSRLVAIKNELRTIVAEAGPAASSEEIRALLLERIDERLAETVEHLIETAPAEEEAEAWLAGIRSAREAAGWRARLGSVEKLSASQSVDEHLEELRRLEAHRRGLSTR